MLAPFFWFMGAARDFQSRTFILELLIYLGTNLFFHAPPRFDQKSPYPLVRGSRPRQIQLFPKKSNEIYFKKNR